MPLKSQTIIYREHTFVPPAAVRLKRAPAASYGHAVFPLIFIKYIYTRLSVKQSKKELR